MKIASSLCHLFRLTLFLVGLDLLACSDIPAVQAADNTAASIKAARVETETVAFEDGDATTEGIDEDALQILVKRAGETHSNALVIVKNGKLIGQWYFGHAVKSHPLNSITKSITSLAIGRLIDDHKIASLDVPLASFYPQWRSGLLNTITLRQVMTHTSGLNESIADFSAENKGSAPNIANIDVLKAALDAPLKDKPGSKFTYNNRAVNLLTGVVKIAAAKNLDDYVNDKFLKPLNIIDWHWSKDGAGQPIVMGGLSLSAIDLAKFGNMLLANALSNDRSAGGGSKELISKSWIDQSTARAALPKISPNYGLLWWLLEQEPNSYSRIIGFMGRGFHGQFLIVLPEQKLVIVRQISEKSHKIDADDFGDLPDLAKRLCPSSESVQ